MRARIRFESMLYERSDLKTSVGWFIALVALKLYSKKR